MFFEVCNKCRMTFTDEKSFANHKALHTGERRAVDDKPIEKLKKNPHQVPGDMNEDERLEKIRAVNEMRKKLINSGVEAATMKPEEVEKRFAEEFGKKEK